MYYLHLVKMYLLNVEYQPHPAGQFVLTALPLALKDVLVRPVVVVGHVSGGVRVEPVASHEFRLVLFGGVAVAGQVLCQVFTVPGYVLVTDLAGVDDVLVDGLVHPVQQVPLVLEYVVGVVAF